MTMRYITPEITGKLPGDLSPSMGIKFTEVSNGLAATSLLATMGYSALEITDKPPGYLSPSWGTKFANAPNGFAAISKVTSASWPKSLLTLPCSSFRRTSRPTLQLPG